MEYMKSVAIEVNFIRQGCEGFQRATAKPLGRAAAELVRAGAGADYGASGGGDMALCHCEGKGVLCGAGG